VEEVGESASLFDFKNDLCADESAYFSHAREVIGVCVIFKLGHGNDSCMEGPTENHSAIRTLTEHPVEAMFLLVQATYLEEFIDIKDGYFIDDCSPSRLFCDL